MYFGCTMPDVTRTHTTLIVPAFNILCTTHRNRLSMTTVQRLYLQDVACWRTGSRGEYGLFIKPIITNNISCVDSNLKLVYVKTDLLCTFMSDVCVLFTSCEKTGTFASMLNNCVRADYDYRYYSSGLPYSPSTHSKGKTSC